MNLQLSLRKEWFDKTKSGEKTEDYREITTYWIRRFFNTKYINYGGFEEMILYYNNSSFYKQPEELFLKHLNVTKKKFTFNTITLGYPKKTDKSKILTYEHAGIEIRQGKEEWGAEKGKFYFVIKHGNIIN